MVLQCTKKSHAFLLLFAPVRCIPHLEAALHRTSDPPWSPAPHSQQVQVNEPSVASSTARPVSASATLASSAHVFGVTAQGATILACLRELRSSPAARAILREHSRRAGVHGGGAAVSGEQLFARNSSQRGNYCSLRHIVVSGTLTDEH